MSPDVTWQSPEMGNVVFYGKRKGREAVAEFFSLLNETQESIRFEPKDFIAQDDKAAAAYKRKSRDYRRNQALTAGATPPNAEAFADIYMALIEGAHVVSRGHRGCSRERDRAAA